MTEAPGSTTTTPKLEQVVVEVNDDVEEETTKNLDFEKELKSRLAEVLALASAVLAIISMVFFPSGVVIAAGVIAIGIAVLVVYQQENLQDTDSLRKVQNDVRKEVNRLQIENTKLTVEVDKLEGSVSKLKASETKLESIALEQGSNVSSLVSLVKENGKIQEQMIDITKAETLQKLYDAVLQSDRDGDFKIGQAEASELLYRIQVDPRVSISKENLTAKFASTPEGKISIRDLTQDILSAQTEAGDHNIFSFKLEKS